MIAHDIIVRPIITEKSMLGAVNKVYTFEVAKTANKIEIAKACEAAFKVKVAKVNTVSVRGKFRRQGRNNGGYTKKQRRAAARVRREGVIRGEARTTKRDMAQSDRERLTQNASVHKMQVVMGKAISRKTIMRRVKTIGN